MILQALDGYYHRLAARPDSVTVPPYGYSYERISFCIVLSKSGEAVDLTVLAEKDRKQRLRPKLLEVPTNPVEERTSNIAFDELCCLGIKFGTMSDPFH